VSPEAAKRLARRLLGAWPSSGANERTAEVYADRLLRMEEDSAAAVVERLIDHCRYLPTIVELRESYREEVGGADPGRNMSPADPRDRPGDRPLTREESKALLGRLRREAQDRASVTGRGEEE